MEDNLLEAYFKAYLMVLLMFKHAFVCLVSWHPPSLPPFPIPSRPHLAAHERKPMFYVYFIHVISPVPNSIGPLSLSLPLPLSLGLALCTLSPSPHPAAVQCHVFFLFFLAHFFVPPSRLLRLLFFCLFYHNNSTFFAFMNF